LNASKASGGAPNTPKSHLDQSSLATLARLTTSSLLTAEHVMPKFQTAKPSTTQKKHVNFVLLDMF
jgi:hypothetical protein